MNALLSIKGQHEYQVDEKEKPDNGTFGYIFAVSLISIYTLFSLVISSWSAVLFIGGSSPNNAPIGLIVDFIKTSGIL